MATITCKIKNLGNGKRSYAPTLPSGRMVSAGIKVMRSSPNQAETKRRVEAELASQGHGRVIYVELPDVLGGPD